MDLITGLSIGASNRLVALIGWLLIARNSLDRHGYWSFHAGFFVACRRRHIDATTNSGSSYALHEIPREMTHSNDECQLIWNESRRASHFLDTRLRHLLAVVPMPNLNIAASPLSWSIIFRSLRRQGRHRLVRFLQCVTSDMENDIPSNYQDRIREDVTWW